MLVFFYAQSLNKCNLMGMEKTLRLFTETVQEEAILNGNERMQYKNYLRTKKQSSSKIMSILPNILIMRI